jgi:integrase
MQEDQDTMPRTNRIKLTKRLIDTAELRAERYDIRDDEVRGLLLRVHPNGTRVFMLTYRTAGGAERRPAIGTYGSITLDQARGIAKDMLARVRAGEDPSQDRQDARQAPTVAELCDRYLDEHARPHKKPSSVEEDRRNIEKHVKPMLGSRKVASVTVADVQRLHRGMRDRPIAANRTLALLSKMFNLAEKWRLRPEHSNPCRHVEKYPEHQIHRPLTVLELARLAKVLREAETADPPEAAENPRAVAALRLLMFTGMRRNEALRLTWACVDLDAGVLRLADSKTGAKVVRLNGAAREVIAAQEPMVGNPYVFPSPVIPGAPLYDIKGVWRRIRELAGLGDVRLHDLRHNFAAAAAAGGLSLHQIGQLLGHRNPSTTARYSDLVDDAAARAAEQVGEALTRAMNGGGR